MRRDSNGVKRKVPIVLPSADYEAWFKHSMEQAMFIKAALNRRGAALPLEGPVSVRALFYRARNMGDLTGFENALGDWLQMPRQKDGKTTRQGAGFIVDDRFIESWDGSRKLVDAEKPRIEVTIEQLAPGLFDAPEEVESD